MKPPPYFVCLLTIAGCASGGDIVGVKPASDTSGLMLTARPADQVAQCIASTLGSTAQPEGSGFAITLPGALAAVYHVRPFDDKLHRYTTIVEISGSTEAPKGTAPAMCLADRAARS
ncbi:MAG: hypothetical protein ACRYFW_00150 [Janthinobacterium lividum]